MQPSPLFAGRRKALYWPFNAIAGCHRGTLPRFPTNLLKEKPALLPVARPQGGAPEKLVKTPLHFFTALLIVIFDQLTKYMVRTSLEPFETVRVLPFLQLVSVRNKGAAFGLFKGFGNSTFIVISVAAIILISYLLTKSREERFGLSLILGGAIGNLIDRIVFGKVTDFIDVFAGTFHWPAFNVADSALTIGLIVMVLTSFFHAKREEPA
jgi:signal peptidase II